MDVWFKITFGICWIIYIVIRIPYDVKYKEQKKEKVVRPILERLLILFNFVGMILIPFIWILTPYLNSFAINLAAPFRLLGVVILTLSLFLFWLVHKTLGANWSPTLELREGHELVQKGIYKFIRHPMYSQIWLWTIAQVLIVSNSIAGFSGLLVWSVMYFVRVRAEEKMLLDKFGSNYKEYKKRTGSVVPNISFLHKKYIYSTKGKK